MTYLKYPIMYQIRLFGRWMVAGNHRRRHGQYLYCTIDRVLNMKPLRPWVQCRYDYSRVHHSYYTRDINTCRICMMCPWVEWVATGSNHTTATIVSDYQQIRLFGKVSDHNVTPNLMVRLTHAAIGTIAIITFLYSPFYLLHYPLLFSPKLRLIANMGLLNCIEMCIGM